MNNGYTLRAIQIKDRMADLIPDVSIPNGKRDTAYIDQIVITEDEVNFANLRLAMNSQGHRAVAPGTYTRLVADGDLQMTDTPAEKMDHAYAVKQATGSCLVMGLGIGMVASAMARKPEVTDITVIERNPDVIDLVAPYLDPKITVIEADALTWEPPKGKKWAVVWHDIWQSICLDDCESRAKLSRKYARRWTVYHGSWAKDEIRAQQSKR